MDVDLVEYMGHAGFGRTHARGPTDSVGVGDAVDAVEGLFEEDSEPDAELYVPCHCSLVSIRSTPIIVFASVGSTSNPASLWKTG